MPYNQIIAIATIGGWLLSNERKLPPPDPVLLLILMLFALATVSSFFSLAPELTWPKWNEFSKTIIYVLMLSIFLTTKARIHAFVWLVVLCIGFFGVKGGALFLPSGGNHHFTGPRGTYIEDRNHLAAAILMVIPLMNYLHLESANVWIRRGLTLATVLSVFAIIGTYSRGGLIGLVAVGGFFWWHSRHKLIAFLGVALIATLVAQLAPSAWVDRMRTIETADQADASFQGRLAAWQTFLEAGMDRPLIGAGMYSLNKPAVHSQYEPREVRMDRDKPIARAAHSIYSQSISEIGLISVFIFSTMIIFVLFPLKNRIKHNKSLSLPASHVRLVEMTRVSVIACLTCGAALSLAYYDLFYIIMMICVISARVSAPIGNAELNKPVGLTMAIPAQSARI